MKYDELISKLCERAPWCPDTEAKLMAEVANAIEELQKENLRLHAFNDANLEAREMLHERIKELTYTNVGKWIPVTERLPEDDHTVLVWSHRNSKEYFNVYDHGKWVIMETEDITHWMPLPKPPKEGE